MSYPNHPKRQTKGISVSKALGKANKNSLLHIWRHHTTHRIISPLHHVSPLPTLHLKKMTPPHRSIRRRVKMQANRILRRARVFNRVQAERISHVRDFIRPEGQAGCLLQGSRARVQRGCETPFPDGPAEDFHQAVRVGVVVDRRSFAGCPDQEEEVEDPGHFTDEVAGVLLFGIGVCEF